MANNMSRKTSLRQRWREKRRIAPLRQSVAELCTWFNGQYGKALLKEEKAILDEQLNCLFGYHLMQLSANPFHDLTQASRISHCFSLSPCSQHKNVHQDYDCLQPSAVADFESLPLGEEMVDVTILHHVLEFSSNPQQVLKEASRVTIPRGYLIIFAFNPFSLVGAVQPLMQLYGKGAIWKRRNLAARRLKDWLEFLDFSCLDVIYLSNDTPFGKRKLVNPIKALCSPKIYGKIPFSANYCIVARKDKVGMTPIKPDWQHSRFIGSPVTLPKRMSARRAHKAPVLPLRRRPRD